MLSDSEPDSDVELQEAFKAGFIKPGLNVETAPTQRIINNVEGMKRKLEQFGQPDLGWVERLAVVSQAPQTEDTAELSPDQLENDFVREMKFYNTAATSAREGLKRLQALGVPTKRPKDFYAEMAKSDDHMKRVREKLLSKKQSLERSEKAKKLRQLRQYGKKVQQETMLRRQKEKKELLDNLKKYKKGQTDQDIESVLANKKTHDKPHQPNKKRQYKNKKFGFGGQKKRSKQNTAESAKDVRGFKQWIHQPKAGQGGKKKRPGKVARKRNKARH